MSEAGKQTENDVRGRVRALLLVPKDPIARPSLTPCSPAASHRPTSFKSGEISTLLSGRLDLHSVPFISPSGVKRYATAAVR
jgi:hypothetical protein